MARIESAPHTAVEYIESYIKNSGYPVEAWDICSVGEELLDYMEHHKMPARWAPRF